MFVSVLPVLLFTNGCIGLSIDVANHDERKATQKTVHEYHECLGRRERRMTDALRKRTENVIDDEATDEDEMEDEEEMPLTTKLRNEGEDLELDCDVCQPPTGPQKSDSLFILKSAPVCVTCQLRRCFPFLP